MVRMNSRRTIRPKRIERSREIYKDIAANAAACGMTPKQFAERFMEQALRELRKLSWISRRELRGSGASSDRLSRADRVEEVRPSGWDLSNWLRLPLQRFLTQCVLTPYCRKCLVLCGEDLRVRQQIMEHVLAWTDDNHTFASSQS